MLAEPDGAVVRVETGRVVHARFTLPGYGGEANDPSLTLVAYAYPEGAAPALAGGCGPAAVVCPAGARGDGAGACVATEALLKDSDPPVRVTLDCAAGFCGVLPEAVAGPGRDTRGAWEAALAAQKAAGRPGWLGESEGQVTLSLPPGPYRLYAGADLSWPRYLHPATPDTWVIKPVQQPTHCPFLSSLDPGSGAYRPANKFLDGRASADHEGTVTFAQTVVLRRRAPGTEVLVDSRPSERTRGAPIAAG